MAIEPTNFGPQRGDHDVALPWDENAERAVLGSILLDNANLDRATETLRPDDFYKPAHRAVYEAMLELARRQDVVDPLTVRARLQESGELERVGGMPFIVSLVDGIPHSANVAAYATLVRDASVKRALCRVAEEIRETTTGHGLSMRELIDKAENAVFQVSQRGRTRGFMPIGEIGEPSMAYLEHLYRHRGTCTGVRTGFYRLDEMTSGLQSGDLVILAARPSMGKTALALNMTLHAALEDRVGVGFFSLEMSSQQLFLRLLSGASEVDSHRMRTGNLKAEDWPKLMASYEELVNSRIYIDDTPAITPLELSSKARRLKSEDGNLGLIVVDYLQLMRLDRRTDSRQQEISEISRSLKGIAKDLGVPVLALSQLSRAPDQRQGDHRPQLSDLRESGAIEQDADVVLFIFRPEVYEKDPEQVQAKELEGKAEVIVAKQRNGPVGTVHLVFIKKFTRFVNAAMTA